MSDSDDNTTPQEAANASILSAISLLLESGAFTIIPHPTCAFLLCPATDEAGQHFGDLLPLWLAQGRDTPSEEDDEASISSFHAEDNDSPEDYENPPDGHVDDENDNVTADDSYFGRY